MTTDDTERLRALQAFGYSAAVLGWGEIRPATAEEKAAYKRGLQGEPPPCGCAAVLQREYDAAASLYSPHGHDTKLLAALIRECARAALGDTEAVK